MDEEDFGTRDEASESESEMLESDRGSKHTRDKAPGDEESADDKEVKEQRSQRRRKFMWVD